MATKHRVITTDAEIDAAIAAAGKASEGPRALSITYRPGAGLDLYILELSNGHRCAIPREELEGLATATRRQAAQVEIFGNGCGLHWPELDIDLSVAGVLEGIYGSQRWMAELGRRGGKATTPLKRQASRLNGTKGGRPKLATATA